MNGVIGIDVIAQLYLLSFTINVTLYHAHDKRGGGV